jgi:hypothetical protein
VRRFGAVMLVKMDETRCRVVQTTGKTLERKEWSVPGRGSGREKMTRAIAAIGTGTGSGEGMPPMAIATGREPRTRATPAMGTGCDAARVRARSVPRSSHAPGHWQMARLNRLKRCSAMINGRSHREKRGKSSGIATLSRIPGPIGECRVLAAAHCANNLRRIEFQLSVPPG